MKRIFNLMKTSHNLPSEGDGGKTRGDWTSETVQDEVENLEGMSFDSKSELKDHLDTLYHYEGEEGEYLAQEYIDDVWDALRVRLIFLQADKIRAMEDPPEEDSMSEEGWEHPEWDQ